PGRGGVRVASRRDPTPARPGTRAKSALTDHVLAVGRDPVPVIDLGDVGAGPAVHVVADAVAGEDLVAPGAAEEVVAAGRAAARRVVEHVVARVAVHPVVAGAA